jgi:hypothetical protein
MPGVTIAECYFDYKVERNGMKSNIRGKVYIIAEIFVQKCRWAARDAYYIVVYMGLYALYHSTNWLALPFQSFYQGFMYNGYFDI